MGRKILGMIGGVIFAGLVIFAVQKLGHQVYPPPENLDTRNLEAMQAYIASLPIGAMLFVLLSYVVGTFAGGWLATKIARAPQMHVPLTVGGVQLFFGIINLAMIPHPLWFAIASVLIFLPAAYLGGKLGRPA